MKKLLYLAMVLMTVQIQAQIDRSIQPKPGPAPEIKLGSPETLYLENGLEVLLVPNTKLPRVSYSLLLDNPPVGEGNKVGVSALTFSLMGKGSVNMDKDSFYEAVDQIGARVELGVTRGSASGLAKYADQILSLMADAALHPAFTEEELQKEKDILLTNLKNRETNVSGIASLVSDVLAYGKNHPKGEFLTEESIKAVTLDDVKTWYGNYFVPENAYLVVIGDFDVEKMKEQVREKFQEWKRATPPTFSYSKPQNAQYLQINFVDMPNAVQSEITLQNVVELTMNDADYFPVLLANYMLGGGAEGRLFQSLREDKGYTYGAYSSIGTDKNAPTTFRASTSVRNQVTDSAVVVMLDEINKFINEPVTDQELAIAKAKYAGSFVMSLENPATIANLTLNERTQRLSENFYANYLENIQKVSKEDIARVAKRYFNLSNARIVIAGKGEEVIPALEKVSFNGRNVPVRYFSKEGEPVDKPSYETASAGDITPEAILQKYIDALGGKEKLEQVESVSIVSNVSVQGMTLQVISKKMNGKILTDTQMQGNSMSKQVYDGEKAFIVARGQRQDLQGAMAETLAAEAYPFPELGLLNSDNVSVEGIADVNGNKAYVVKTSDSKKSYFDTESGLKLKEETVVNMGGQQITQTVVLGDYKEVQGIQFPHSVSQSVGPQSFDGVVTEIKVNEGVSEEDFK